MTSLKKKRRSELPSELSRISKKSKISDDYEKDNLLCEVTKKAGLVLKKNGSSSVLDGSKAAFQKQLGSNLKSHSGDLLQNVEAFVEEFGEYIEDQKRFHQSLMNCVSNDESDSGPGPVTDSVVRLLLGVDVIQSPLMSLLLDKLQEFVGDEEDYIFYQGQKRYIPRLVLSQFRFLDRIVDGNELTKKLLEILAVTSLEVQREIIACLPDIVEDAEHGEVARTLRDELTSNKQLTCPVIDALTYLSIPQDLVSEIRTSVLDMLRSFSISDQPIVVNFLLESVNAADALEVVSEIRTKIDFTTSSKLPKDEMEKVKTNINETVKALKGRMLYQKFVAEAWIKVLDSALELRVLDVFVLLILHFMNHRRAVESLVRNKVRGEALTGGLVTKAFTQYPQVVREYFPQVQALAQALLRSPEVTICHMGCLIYTQAFTAFDAYCKQEIVASLVAHIGSGFAGEIDASLDILADLVKHQPDVMSRYAVFIKVVLDYLDHNNLTVAQIRKLYLLLAQLAFHNTSDGGYLQDDLHIIVRKQLTLPNSRYKRMGVTGAISILHALAQDTQPRGEEPRELGVKDYKQVVELLEMVQSSSKRDPEMCALFLDSLATMMSSENLYANVERWIDENMNASFEENYILDAEEGAPLVLPAVSVPGVSLYDLNMSEGTICINLLPTVERLYDKLAQKTKDSTTSALCLCPLFHLLTVSTKKSESDLDSIDALLGCPVYTLEADIWDKMAAMTTKEKDVVCASLFVTINWFREVINSFAAVDVAEIKAKVMMRLKHVTELQVTLEKCLAQHSTFLPPPAIFDLDTNFNNKLSTSASTSKSAAGGGEKKKGGKGGKGKGKKEKENLDNSAASQLDKTNADGTQKTQEETDSGKDDKCVDLSAYREYFRELDLSVFTILKAGLVTKAALDSEMNTKDTEKVEICLPELQFLLEDLTLKLSHSLVTSSVKRRSFLKPRGNKRVGFTRLDLATPAMVAGQGVKLLPSLLEHLEEACTYFQTLTADNDGLEDGPNRFTPQSLQVATCYHLLLQSLLSLFSWNGFSGAAHKAQLKEALLVMVTRMRAGQEDTTTVSQQDAFSCVFQYLSNFVETVPSLEAGVTLLKLLVVLAERAGKEDMNTQLTKQAKAFLNREWRGPDGEKPKGAKHNELLQIVIKTFIVYSDDGFEAMQSLAIDGLGQLDSGDKDGSAPEFLTLTRHTFSTFHKVVLSELISRIKQIPPIRKKDSEEVKEDAMLRWFMAVKIFGVSVLLVQTFSARSNLSAVLKYGRMFLEIFLRLGMPVLDVTFRRHHDRVELLLKSLQKSTRMLHHMCGHSKVSKDVALINQVPMLKRHLEVFVYRVKAMLALNNCQDAFWMGNLKNRNLQGKEILTQNSSIASSGDTTANEEGEDNEEEAPEDNDDDEDSEIEMDNAEGEVTEISELNSRDTGGSYSEIF